MSEAEQAIQDKIKKLQSIRGGGGGFTKQRGIFHNLQDGDNIIRLVGDPVKVVMHFISPSHGKNKNRGICADEAFEGDDRLPKRCVCPDWDIDSEEFKSERECPVCKLNNFAKRMVKEGGDSLDPKDKKWLEMLASAARPAETYKWNIIDRANPNIIEIDQNGVSKDVPGFKVTSIGVEAANDVVGILKQMSPKDITADDEGCDINIIRSSGGPRVSYSAQVVIDGGMARFTPLTDEELSATRHDLKRIIGKPTTVEQLMDHMHDDYKEVINQCADGSTPKKQVSTAKAPVEPKAPEAPEEPEEPEEPEDGPKADPELESDEESVEDQPWECFGCIKDVNHPECSKCSEQEDCIKKSEEIEEPKKRSRS